MIQSAIFNQVGESKLESGTKAVLISFLASILVALAAPITIPLPFTPVPIVLQAHMVLLFSALLGSRRAFMMVAFFICQGALGLPVFAGGTHGLLPLIGPRAGYLFGYLAAAFLVGRLQERSLDRSPLKLLGHMALGNAVIFLFGVLWLSTFLGPARALLLGFVPFIPLDVVKLLIAAKICPARSTA